MFRTESESGTLTGPLSMETFVSLRLTYFVNVHFYNFKLLNVRQRMQLKDVNSRKMKNVPSRVVEKIEGAG